MTGKFYSTTQTLRSSVRGFTLIEMLIAISVFAIVLLIIVNVYVVVNNSQRKVVTLQKIQDDTRFLYEAMAQEIRLGSIDFNFYATVASGINLEPTLGGTDNYVLAIVTQSQEHVFFRRSSLVANDNDGAGDTVQYCAVDAANSCGLDDDSLWQDITPEGVSVLDLRFLITPSADPFTATAEQTCAATSECDPGYVCDATCQYFSDGGNYQPKVRIVMNTVGRAGAASEESHLTVQTTISTRLFTGPILNLNFQ